MKNLKYLNFILLIICIFLFDLTDVSANLLNNEVYTCKYVSPNWKNDGEVVLNYEITFGPTEIQKNLKFPFTTLNGLNMIDTVAWLHEDEFETKYLKLITTEKACPTITVTKIQGSGDIARMVVHPGNLEERSDSLGATALLPEMCQIETNTCYVLEAEFEQISTATPPNTTPNVETNTETQTNSKPETTTPTTNNAQNNTDTGAYVKCGSIDSIPAALPALSRNVINLIKIFIPIILCVMGMLDFAKSVIAGDEKAMSEGPKKFVKRVISAVLVFFIVAIVQFIINMLSASGSDIDENSDFTNCLKCFVTDEDACVAGNATIINTN